MPTRHDEDRASDITAVDCDGCGAEGHTAQSGGDISEFEGPKIPGGGLDDVPMLYICDECLNEHFTQEEQEAIFDTYPLLADQFTRLRECVDEERKGHQLPPLGTFQPNWAELGPELLAALKALFEHCAMIHSKWGDGCNRAEADTAIAAAKAIIARAEGRQP